MDNYELGTVRDVNWKKHEMIIEDCCGFSYVASFNDWYGRTKPWSKKMVTFRAYARNGVAYATDVTEV